MFGYSESLGAVLQPPQGKSWKVVNRTEAFSVLLQVCIASHLLLFSLPLSSCVHSCVSLVLPVFELHVESHTM